MELEKLFTPIWKRFRPARMRQMVEVLGITSETRILDVGGAERNWSYLDFMPRVTVLNLLAEGAQNKFPWVFADARSLPFADKSFDVVFSNSAIEHLGTVENQRLMAEEVRRVGKRYYVQTPDFWFPFDVHMLAPFVHWLPRSIQKRIVRYCTPWGYLHKLPQPIIDRVIDEICLLKTSQLRTLFPDGKILHERFLGISKSLICIGP